jgi:hypothetical protein
MGRLGGRVPSVIMPPSAQRRPLVPSEVTVLERCSEAPCGRLDFGGLERMALQVLAARGWVTQVASSPMPLYQTSPAGIVALQVARLEAV